MDNNLVNGWYKCIKGDDCWTEGEFYYFKNGCTKDDKGNRRPCNGASPQAYNDPVSEKWFKYSGLVPADEKEVYGMKHDTMNDNRVNGFYKATKTSASWSEGKQYYFRDGYTVDDSGDGRPCSVPLKYNDARCERWLKDEGLVPATNKMDIFDRANAAAVNCTDNHLECDGAECPYLNTPNCKDQMIDDFKALRKELEHEACKPVMVGCFCRDRRTLELFKIVDASVGPILGVEIYGVGTGRTAYLVFHGLDEFYNQFEPWERDQKGGSFDFVALEDLPLLVAGHVYCVDGGKILGIPKNDLRFKSYEELEKYFDGKTIQTDVNHQIDDPTEGLYTGFAVAVKDFRAVSKVMTKGKIYRFVNGVAKLDNDLTMLFPDHVFDLYFKPVTNL